ncbi:hypothetical protein QJQ45_008833 [Haematococcus lacustris]|nr:hypothetical protein QJQ45_008833 [Haematococcus lacustris]
MVHGVLKLVDLVELRQNQLAIRFLQSIEQTFLPIESPMFSCRWPDPVSFAQWGQQFADPAAWLDQIGVIWIVMLLGITIVVVDLNKGFMQHYTPSSVLELLMGEDAAATAAELLPLITPRLSSSLRVREVAMVVEADRHFRSSCDPTPAPPIPSTRVDALQREVIRLKKQLVRAKAMRLPPVARLALAYVRNEYQMRQILRSAGLMAEGRGQEGTQGKDHEPPTPPRRGQVVHLEEPRRGAGPRGRVDHAHYLRALEMQVDTGLSFNAIPKALKGSFAVMAPGQQLEVSIPCARSYGRASEDIALTVTEGQARNGGIDTWRRDIAAVTAVMAATGRSITAVSSLVTLDILNHMPSWQLCHSQADNTYRDNGITRQAPATKTKLAHVKSQFNAPSQVSSKPTMMASYQRLANAIMATAASAPRLSRQLSPASPPKAKGKAAKAKPAPQPDKWLDRECNAALNMQCIGESRWHLLELWWPDLPKLLAKGKEYSELGYKRLRDRPPKA